MNVTENFDGVTAPALPSGWTAQSSGFTTTTTGATPRSSPNMLKAVTAGQILLFTYNTQDGSGNLTFKACVYFSATNQECTLGVRLSTQVWSTCNGYLFQATTYTNTQAGAVVSKKAAGTTTALISRVGASGTFGVGWYELSFIVDGSVLKARACRLSDGNYLNSSGSWVSGVTELASFTDSTYASSGYFGLLPYETSGTNIRIDDISMASIVAGVLTAGTISLNSKTDTTINLSVTEASSGTSPYTRQWYRSTTSGFTPGAGNIISGATGLSLNDTGLTPATTYYYKVVHTDSAGTPATATTSELMVATNSTAVALNPDGAYWSPGVVRFDGSNAAHITETGTYFKTNFTGTDFGLRVNVSTLKTNSIAASVWPQLLVNCDGAALATVNVTDPGTGINTLDLSLASGLVSGTHSIEVTVQMRNETDSYTPKDELIIEKILATTLATPTGAIAARPKKALLFGDSITRGYAADSVLTRYAQTLMYGLNAEMGIVGKSGQGWQRTYNGWTGYFKDTWNMYDSTHARAFPSDLDYFIVNQGTNDTTSVTTTITTWLPQARAAIGATCWIILICPFNGTRRSEIEAAVTAYKTSSGDTKVVSVAPADVLPYTATAYYLIDTLHPIDRTMAYEASALAGLIARATTAAAGGTTYLLRTINA